MTLPTVFPLELSTAKWTASEPTPPELQAFLAIFRKPSPSALTPPELPASEPITTPATFSKLIPPGMPLSQVILPEPTT